VDLDKLDSVTVNKTVEELKEQVRLNEVKNAKHLHRMQVSTSDSLARSRGGWRIRGQCPPMYILCPPKCDVPRKICFTKILPP